MKWLILAILAEIGVLVSLIIAFDGAMHSLATARLTWDHAVVFVIYTTARASFSWKRIAQPQLARIRVRDPLDRAR